MYPAVDVRGLAADPPRIRRGQVGAREADVHDVDELAEGARSAAWASNRSKSLRPSAARVDGTLVPWHDAIHARRRRTSYWGKGISNPASPRAVYRATASSLWVCTQRSKRLIQARSSKRRALSPNPRKSATGAGSGSTSGCARATASKMSSIFSGGVPYATPTPTSMRRRRSDSVQLVTFSAMRLALGTITSAPSQVRTVQARMPSCSTRPRSEEHTSELQSHHELVCRLLLEKK